MKNLIRKTGLVFLFFFPLVIMAQTERLDTSEKTEEVATIAPKAQNIEIMDPLKYPLKAVRKKIEGKVVIDIEVDENGNYVGHNIVKSADDILAEAVDPFIPKLIFMPGMKGEEPMAGVAQIQVIFNIQSRIPIKTEITIKFEGQ